MSTHGCFATFFPYTRLLRSDDGPQEPADPVDDYYYPDGAYCYMETDDQEWSGGSRGGGLCLFDLDVIVLLSLLKANLFIYVYTKILTLSLTYVFEPSWPWFVI